MTDGHRRVNPLVPRGSSAERPFDVCVSPESAGWQYSGLRVVHLPVGGRVKFVTGPDEMLVLPLSGGCDVACDDERLTLTGRRSVFSRVTDFAYLPRNTAVSLRAPNGGRFALPAARASRTLPFRYGPAEEVPVEPHLRSELCLGGEELEMLEALAARCESLFDGAHDIEWAFSGGRLYLLQRRSITR